MFNPVTYFKNLKETLKATNNNFFFGKSTSLSHLEDLLNNQRKHENFFIVQHVADGVTVSSGSGFFDKKSCVVFILKKYNIHDQDDRDTKLQECKQIQRSIESRLLIDSKKEQPLFYLNKQRMPYYELPGFFAAGTCGLYMVVSWEDPKDLCYDSTEWEENTPPTTPPEDEPLGE